MEAVVVQIKNKQAFKFFKNLEDLKLIKILQRIPYLQAEIKINNKENNIDRTKRLASIQAITKNINIDLTDFHFNRDEANNYD